MIRIDLDSPRPLEEQIVTSLRHALAQGAVGAGDELPSVRQLADDLGVHWNTVARAYRRLAEEGLLVVRRGRGAVVGPPRRAAGRVSRVGLRERFTESVAAGLVGGLTREEIAQAFREALASFGERTR